tara:strand:+ start:807 stop:1265 length:459 start_codon:yes stop_codon:yes gene_type:complete
MDRFTFSIKFWVFSNFSEGVLSFDDLEGRADDVLLLGVGRGAGTGVELFRTVKIFLGVSFTEAVEASAEPDPDDPEPEAGGAAGGSRVAFVKKSEAELVDFPIAEVTGETPFLGLGSTSDPNTLLRVDDRVLGSEFSLSIIFGSGGCVQIHW